MVRLLVLGSLIASCSHGEKRGDIRYYNEPLMGEECKPPVLEEFPDTTLTGMDLWAYNQAIRTCRVTYKSCLLRFIYRGHNNYWAICGQHE